MATISISIDEDLLRETLISLRDRNETLRKEQVSETIPYIKEIINRQQRRVFQSIEAVQTALGESF